MNLSDEIPLLSSFYPLRYDTGSNIPTFEPQHLLGPPQVTDQLGGEHQGSSPATRWFFKMLGGNFGGETPAIGGGGKFSFSPPNFF